MSLVRIVWASLLLVSLLPAAVRAAEAEGPPGWFPVLTLDRQTAWETVREDKEHVRLYLPAGDQPVRGVFACIVFHSADPRELADAWNFALVTVPTPHLFDLGDRDKRNKRSELGHPAQGMKLLLRYLNEAATGTGHAELATAPLVGWFGQGGAHFCQELLQLAPGRVLAWSDSFAGPLRQYPELTRSVPYALAWEVSKPDLQARRRTPHKNNPAVHDDLSCQASTYGFPHGIYSKYNFFMAYLDRCIRARLPEAMPSPGQPVTLKRIARGDGWVGDYAPISEWNPIAQADSSAAKTMEHPAWMPDAYAAAMWRAYHSAEPDIKLTGPVIPYHNRGRGPKMGLGYGGFLPTGEALPLTAEAKGDYASVEFYDGDQLLGRAESSPWRIDGVQLEAGLHVLYAVGVKADGARVAARPAMAIARPME